MGTPLEWLAKNYMENKKKLVSNDIYFAYVEEMIGEGRSVEVPLRGVSMQPSLYEGRHSIVLVPVDTDKDLFIGCIALFVFKGRHVVHRLIGVDGDICTFKGDNLPTSKEIVRREDVKAIVSRSLSKEGETIDYLNKRYRFYSRYCLIPALKVWHLMRRIYCKLSH